MPFYLKRILYILFFVFISYANYATHIVGGAFDVQWFGFSRQIATCDKGKETDKRCQEVNALNRRCEVYIKRIK